MKSTITRQGALDAFAVRFSLVSLLEMAKGNFALTGIRSRVFRSLYALLDHNFEISGHPCTENVERWKKHKNYCEIEKRKYIGAVANNNVNNIYNNKIANNNCVVTLTKYRCWNNLTSCAFSMVINGNK